MTNVYIVEHEREVYIGSNAVRPDGLLVVTPRGDQDMEELSITGLLRRPDSNQEVGRFGIPETTGHFFLPAFFDGQALARPILMGIDVNGSPRVHLELIEEGDKDKMISVITTPDKDITFVLGSLSGTLRPVQIAVERDGIPVEPIFLDKDKPVVEKWLTAGNYRLVAKVRREDGCVGEVDRLSLSVPIDQVGGSEEADLEILPP